MSWAKGPSSREFKAWGKTVAKQRLFIGLGSESEETLACLSESGSVERVRDMASDVCLLLCCNVRNSKGNEYVLAGTRTVALAQLETCDAKS